MNVATVRDWLANLSERERNLVYAAAALLGVALLYVVLVLPFQTAQHKLASRVEKKTGDLAWLQANAPLAAAAAGMTQQRQSGESLVVLVDRTAREAGLGANLRDQSPDGESGLRLRIEGAQFDTLVTWLASLQQMYGVDIETATVDAAAPGLVNATLGLKLTGAQG
jgi:type II secretory pathway component PulM